MKEKPKQLFVPLKYEVVTLTLRDDLFYYDKFGTIWANVSDAISLDDEVRAGIGIFSIDGYELEVDAHDFIYSNEVAQAFISRSKADLILKEHMKGKWMKLPFYWLSRIFGRFFWENDKTNN